MILKSMSRHDASFGQLLAYVSRDASDPAFIIRHNIYGRSLREVLADFDAYAACHERVARAFQDRRGWAKMVVRNIAKMGYFSSDRSVREYAERVWNVSPVPITPPTP